MKSTFVSPFKRGISKTIVVVPIVLCLLLLTTVGVFAGNVNIHDDARVLNASSVQSAASQLPYAMDIYTVNNFQGTKADFAQRTASHIGGNANLIVMAIDTVNHYVYIKAGNNVPLSSSEATTAISAFSSNYNSGGYTGATVAAIQSLQNSLSSTSGAGNRGATTPQQNTGGFLGGLSFTTICCVGLLVLAGIAVFAFVRRRNRGGMFNQPRVTPFNQNQFNQGYPPNQPYNQGYPPNYGPGYNQGQGMNPWAAGGLGAAAGGLAGYELGRMQGEGEAREDQNNGGFLGNNNDQGSNNGGDFGGGAGGGFGGGGGDFGGGGGNDGGGGGGSF